MGFLHFSLLTPWEFIFLLPLLYWIQMALMKQRKKSDICYLRLFSRVGSNSMSCLFSTQGVSLTAQRAAIVVGVELPVYDLTKKHLILSGLMGDTVYTHFLYVDGFYVHFILLMIFFWGVDFGTTPGSAQGLLLALHSGIILMRLRGLCCERSQNQVNSAQGKYLTLCPIPDPVLPSCKLGDLF